MAKTREGSRFVVRLCKLLVLFVFMLLAACGTQDGTTTTSDAQGVVKLELSTDKDSVSSDGIDVATLTVRALDSNNAVVPGVTIAVSATDGVISHASLTTGDDGAASFTFDSGDIVSNEVSTITVSTPGVVATRTISIVGVSVSFTVDRTLVGLNATNTATVSVRFLNGSGDPLSNQSITLSTVIGYIDSVRQVTLVTDVNGEAEAIYSGGDTAGVDTLTLNSGDESRSLQMTISGEVFTLTDSLGGTVDVDSSDVVSLTWIDDNGSPVVGKQVRFSCTKCSFDQSDNNFIEGVTNSAGQFSAEYVPVSVGPDIVTVEEFEGLALIDALDITIITADANRIIVNASPSVLARAQGESTPISTISATVLDSQNRAVQGVDVAFSIVSGPGGGEIIEPAISRTDESGVAKASLTSGGLISEQDGVVVLARVLNTPSLTDTVSLTIADQAATVVFGQTNVIETTTIGGFEQAYSLPFTVLVTDTNGSAISGQNVSLSLYPLRFKTGTVEAEGFVTSGTYVNEDANRNGILDAGEDSTSGPFSNGRLDPGGVASIPAIITTDDNGFAAFSIVYAKSFGAWVDVELTATANVSGTESTSILVTTLKVQENDIPYIDSPFGP